MPNPNTGIEKELMDLEKQYWQAIKDKDVETAMRLSDDPCIVTGAQGVGKVDRKTLGAMLKTSSYELLDYDLEKPEVLMLSDDVAIVAYKVREQLTVEGKPMALEAADSSTWVRRNGRWVCALHTEALAGDPFGRDRQRVTSTT